MQPIIRGGAGHHAFENVGQIGLGVDALQLAGVEKLLFGVQNWL